jgi:hydroxymethylglutaryl-CoA synthase
MNGIISYGAYLPRHRLDRGVIRKTLGQGGGRGTRSVAGYDEDTTSMAVEAARNARWNGAFEPGGVHFATTAPAYVDKTNATAIHAALELPAETFATDHGASVRSAVGALRAAAADHGLAVTADIRVGRPGSADEAGGGDGAAAFLFGDGTGGGAAVIAEAIGRASATAEFLDRWRAPGDSASSTWEERFGLGEYLPLINDAATRALEQAGDPTPDHVIVSSPHARAATTAAKQFGDAALDELVPLTGYLGAAHASVRLADVLDRAQPGETILIVSAADGADAAVFRVSDAISGRPAGAPAVRTQLEHAREIDYPTFLTWRGRLDREPPRRPDPVRVDAPPAARATRWKYAFVGSKCTSCGRVHVPPQRVCAGCGQTDQMDPEPMSDKLGTVATFTVDRLAYSLSPPVITAVIDFDGGGRVSCELTECTPDQVAVGTQVELTFRRMYSSQGIHNYFWKARPV